MKLGFGKYADTPISKIPHQYLRWALRTIQILTPAQRRAMQQALGETPDLEGEDDGQELVRLRSEVQKLRRQIKDQDEAASILADLLAQKEEELQRRALPEISSWWTDWYRRAAKTCHPDRNGGDDRAMKLVNEIKDRLRQ